MKVSISRSKIFEPITISIHFENEKELSEFIYDMRHSQHIYTHNILEAYEKN